jgi:penicillin-binding protein 2
MNRLVRLQWLVSVALGLLVLRLVHLQVIRGGYYRTLAEQNRLRLVPEQAPRGLIVDRRGRLLASNQTVFRVALVPQELENFPRVLSRVSTLVHRAPEVLRKEYAHERSLAFIPATIVSRVPKDVAIRLEEERWQLPGLLVKPETVRHYPGGTRAAHLLGHLSQPTAEELPALKPYGIHPQHLVGRLGLERLLDQELRGRSGGLMVEVDHRARQVRVLGQRPAAPGERIELTVDAQLQSLLEQAFGEQAGAAVALDPSTGEILAMVSRPAFSPEAFTLLDSAAILGSLNDPASPMLNRAAVGRYQPGSIVKLAIAAAALHAGVITPSTVLECPGALTIGDRTIHCWNRDGHGPMNLHEALMQSCNVYFMKVGLQLGAARLLEAMKEMGFSRRTGWPLEEEAGHLPTRRLMKGDVALLSIGQGEIEVTVLQSAVMAAVFANGGTVVQPWVIRRIGERQIPPPPPRRRVTWSSQAIETVRIGMQAVVNDPDGTGMRAKSPLVTIAGKTGTAQTHVEGQTHGWFVGFCPLEHPRVALAIVAEHGGAGGDLPAEIARTVCEYVVAPETL